MKIHLKLAIIQNLPFKVKCDNKIRLCSKVNIQFSSDEQEVICRWLIKVVTLSGQFKDILSNIETKTGSDWVYMVLNEQQPNKLFTSISCLFLLLPGTVQSEFCLTSMPPTLFYPGASQCTLRSESVGVIVHVQSPPSCSSERGTGNLNENVIVIFQLLQNIDVNREMVCM